MIDTTEIEKRIDHAVAGPISVDAELGGLTLKTMGEVMEFAKLMAVSGAAVPKWLRNNPGGCLAICSRALRWQMDPFAVAEKSYLAIGKGGIEHIGFEAQLIHAVITAHAPLKNRLRSEIIGEGDNRRCRVWGTFKGETKPHEYTSETLGKKIADIGKNDKGQIKGSPLWETEPEVQLTYSAVRQWCRLHSSETLLGVYTPDEFEGSAADPSPAVAMAQRLRDAKMAHVETRGFDAAQVAKVIEGEAQEADDDNESSSEQQRTGDEAGVGGRQVASDHRAIDDRDQARSPSGGEKHQGVRATTTRHGAKKEQGEIFDQPKAGHKPQPKKGRR